MRGIWKREIFARRECVVIQDCTVGSHLRLYGAGVGVNAGRECPALMHGVNVWWGAEINSAWLQEGVDIKLARSDAWYTKDAKWSRPHPAPYIRSCSMIHKASAMNNDLWTTNNLLPLQTANSANCQLNYSLSPCSSHHRRRFDAPGLWSYCYRSCRWRWAAQRVIGDAG